MTTSFQKNKEILKKMRPFYDAGDYGKGYYGPLFQIRKLVSLLMFRKKFIPVISDKKVELISRSKFRLLREHKTVSQIKKELGVQRLDKDPETITKEIIEIISVDPREAGNQKYFDKPNVWFFIHGNNLWYILCSWNNTNVWGDYGWTYICGRSRELKFTGNIFIPE